MHLFKSFLKSEANKIISFLLILTNSEYLALIKPDVDRQLNYKLSRCQHLPLELLL